MRHGKTFNHLSRTASHRKALLANMATSLILHKKITTTTAKAKELRKYVEPLITKAKDDSTHSRRVVFSYLKNKESIKELFGPVAGKVADRPGGYTRVLKLMNRKGDNAEMAIIELVDFNENLLKDSSSKASSSKRTRRGKAKTSAPKAEVVAETPADSAE
jgi:large subunit ribosomal protein L17